VAPWEKLRRLEHFGTLQELMFSHLHDSLQNPYVLSADPCGSSTGPAIAAAANMAAVTLGTETTASILCPAALNSVVGIKPTVGLTSRSGVIPFSTRQDTIGYVVATKLCTVKKLFLIPMKTQILIKEKELPGYPSYNLTRHVFHPYIKGKLNYFKRPFYKNNFKPRGPEIIFKLPLALGSSLVHNAIYIIT
jgi:hypothetical protein